MLWTLHWMDGPVLAALPTGVGALRRTGLRIRRAHRARPPSATATRDHGRLVCATLCRAGRASQAHGALDQVKT
jgi:hypothetical protein